MKRIQIRIALLLLYVGVLGYFFYPKGYSLRYREKKRSKYEYGKYPEKGEGQEEK